MKQPYKIQDPSVLRIVKDFNNNCIGCDKCRCLMMDDLNIEMKSFSKKVIKEGFTKKEAFSCVDCMQCNTKCDLNINEIFRSLKTEIYNQVESNKVFNTPYILHKQVKLNHTIPKQRGRIVFMSGCTLKRQPKLVDKALRILKSHDSDIELYEGCCTKPIKLLGNERLHQEYLKQYKENFKDTLIITACFSCTKVLKEHVNTITLYEYMLENNLIINSNFGKYSVKLPCHIDDSNKELCKSFCNALGVDIVNADSTCCGSGGLIGFSNYKLSRKYLNQSIKNLKAKEIVCFCEECNSKIKKKRDSKHIIELL